MTDSNKFKGMINDSMSKIKEIINNFRNTKHIEIEKKYVFGDYEIFNRVKEVIEDWGEYTIDVTNNIKIQVDDYYDTDDNYLFNRDKILRFRKIDGNCKLTIKTPIADGKHNQNERFEYEKSVSIDNIEDNKDYILKYLPDLSNDKKWSSLKKSLTIINKRKQMILSRNSVQFEMVFDDLNYSNTNGNTKPDYQIEIELKSDYRHRVNLKMFSDYIESKVPELISMSESKYKRGTRLTNL